MGSTFRSFIISVGFIDTVVTHCKVASATFTAERFVKTVWHGRADRWCTTWSADTQHDPNLDSGRAVVDRIGHGSVARTVVFPLLYLPMGRV